ncbi:hypothetical protein [Actinomadura miaoliensis]|uniref:hypothetical protein n=1 Tax=Actinomadura miaoliensis TaxID=430685 RepID=UPI0031EB46D9
MTYDVIALTQQMPDVRTLLDGLSAAGDDLRLDVPEHGGVIQLFDDEGGPLLSVEAPVLVQVPGEAERLLGPSAAGLRPPLWWVEARAAERQGAPELARVFADALVNKLGGVVWVAEDQP